MVELYNSEALEKRARSLGTLNGLDLVFVDLEPVAAPTHALLEVKFHKSNELANILDDIQNNGVPPVDIFPLSGGTRRVAGDVPGQVQVTGVSADSEASVLHLRVEPIGDYSTYTLGVVYANIDPLFSRIDFKFRPGCFNLNCAPEWTKSEASPTEPVIDYLAKDYDSFKHVLINAMMARVPGWLPTSEADLDQVLIDLISADADELSDYQDRVVNEAYLGRVRKRISLARHARLMDYHIHQGNQASTWLAVKVAADQTLPRLFGAWTGDDWRDPGTAIFVASADQACFTLLNQLDPYTWGGVVTALEAGGREADLALPGSLDPAAEASADTLRDLLRSSEVRYFCIEEKLNPETGRATGRDKTARQLLRLLDGEAAADSVNDPVANQWMVRVRWREEDKLKRRYCFVTRCTGQPPTEGVSAFHGNLLTLAHGRPFETVFRPPGEPLDPPDESQFVGTNEAHYEPTRWGVLCRLPKTPLAYRNTPPGGDDPVRSTLTVAVSGFADPWDEQSDLIESEEDRPHFIVETDEHDVSYVRFGRNPNGLPLPDGAEVTCAYQVGRGSSGNVGPDAISSFDRQTFNSIEEVWNPLDATNGRDPEAPEVIIRRVPEAYRARQLRAITLEDYVKRAEELPEVSHAYARYAWTGSWRTVRISIDPRDTTTLDDELRDKLLRTIEQHLDAVRLIGEDLEVRLARYVALDIKMRLCAHPDYWPEHLANDLEIEFSDGYTPDGPPGFFHPDQWTFGQVLHASQLIGRALSVQGVDRVLMVSMRRWDAGAGPTTTVVTLGPEDLPDSVVEKIEVEPFEVIRVENDPSHLEHGRVLFEIIGGRQRSASMTAKRRLSSPAQSTPGPLWRRSTIVSACTPRCAPICSIT